jgi:hypothetical protein
MAIIGLVVGIIGATVGIVVGLVGGLVRLVLGLFGGLAVLLPHTIPIVLIVLGALILAKRATPGVASPFGSNAPALPQRNPNTIR